MQVIKLRDDFIKLGQAIKAAGLVESGVEAKIVIQDGEVKVNGAVETQRGKKLTGGEIISYNGEEIKIYVVDIVVEATPMRLDSKSVRDGKMDGGQAWKVIPGIPFMIIKRKMPHSMMFRLKLITQLNLMINGRYAREC